jgi:hypothetical protein
MTALIEVRTVYGRRTYYPANRLAQQLADLAGTATLTPAAIEKIREMGIKVIAKVIAPSLP